MNISQQECCGCGLCVAICPLKCITMQADAEGFFFPHIEEDKCINCGLCQKSCPVNLNAGKPLPSTAGDHCIYAVSADAAQVKNASSGGVFPALAQSFLLRGGGVVGAAFNQQFDVELKLIEDSALLPALMQAKYVQASVPPQLFQQAVNLLQNGRPLLFTGTPCQVAAFRSFCGKRNYPDLLCAEIICHGVPSPAVWRSYLSFVTQNFKEPVSAVYFRDKSTGWHKFSLRIDCGKEKFIQTHKESPYMQLFLDELISRKSCGNCAFKGALSSADLSLGDFWKLKKIAPSMDNSTGVSMVIAHTEAGMAALKKCSWASWHEFPMTCVKISNRAYMESVPPNPSRKEFFARFIAEKQKWFAPTGYFQKKRRRKLLGKIADFLCSKCCLSRIFPRKNSKN